MSGDEAQVNAADRREGGAQQGEGRVELRRPPLAPPAPARDRLARGLLLANLLLVAALGAFLLLRSGGGGGGPAPERAEQAREVAAKLKAAGALDEAAALYEEYLAAAHVPAETRARIAYSLGTTYLDRGRYERALRWFYQAESLGAGPLAGELGERIVETLERLGRFHAAQAALDSRVRLDGDGGEAGEPVARPDDDPVVARIGEREIRRSEVEAALDDLPPKLARDLSGPEAREELLRRVVAEELLWRKAVRLGYDDDPDVRRRHEALLRQLAVSKLIERDVVAGIRADEDDLRNFFAAHPERYKDPESGEAPSFEKARPAVDRDYRRAKIEAGYQALIDAELSTADVKLFPERMADDG